MYSAPNPSVRLQKYWTIGRTAHAPPPLGTINDRIPTTTVNKSDCFTELEKGKIMRDTKRPMKAKNDSRQSDVAPITRTGAKSKNDRSGAGEKTLADLFEHALKDIYYAEKKIYKTLPTMIKAAHDPILREGLSSHRDETATQIERLAHIFELLGKRAKAEKCDAIDGILEESGGLLEDFGNTRTGDAAIIFSCQAVEHYEITRYGSMHTYATELRMSEIADLLKQTLDEEKAADQKLSQVAISRVNYAAEG